ncbi:hypothetical protein [Azospirillum sp. sgz301742]
MASVTEFRGSTRTCTGIPAGQTAEVTQCGDCKSFQNGDCRGRDPQVPLQVCCGVAILCVIFLAATVFP